MDEKASGSGDEDCIEGVDCVMLKTDPFSMLSKYCMFIPKVSREEAWNRFFFRLPDDMDRAW
ncbi:hypothetical protein [Dictyobacter aurantiacus]|uniref:Uncharacterized protein n=1 Tax=Dictyobacter aurantiacus TaxID=1936993 RepID=A0A401ZL61_9CHLR|nr:hypothetical protein [Dictyobacter aurantiacus]GCE07585.1 hypothetical protein KDAU_49140 [Dictyobacter aurantiacus]